MHIYIVQCVCVDWFVVLGSISGACRFALSLLCLCSQTSSDKSRQRQDTQTYGYDNTMYIPTFPCYWEVKYFEARYVSKSQNLDKYLQICGTQKFQGKSSSYTSSEYLLNLRDRRSLRCLIVFFFFLAFLQPLVNPWRNCGSRRAWKS